jgi:cyclopropane-fatty-acyl-phospholipid synthase
MSAIGLGITAAEHLPLPDLLTRAGIDLLVGRTRRRLAALPDSNDVFARDMEQHPVAQHPDAANQQHYELPPAFFELFLGARRKYSCCYYDSEGTTLDEAELLALEQTVLNADLLDGQKILELGCGWGSLTLFMAARFPAARITAVSNSAPQRQFILAEARRLGLRNLEIITADMNDFSPAGQFDRIVSVEMFEHMSNWAALLRRTRGWLAPKGRLFLHVFTHRRIPYRFDHRNDADWIAQHFFTGGIMPSHALIERFDESFDVEQAWQWDGTHYQRTALDWLARFDRNIAAVDPVLAAVYGADVTLWRRRWRLFFMATAGLFGHADGSEWGVSHYRLRPAGEA